MTTATRTYSVEEFMRLPDPADGGHYELVNGDVIRMFPAGGEHGAIGTNIISPLKQFVKRRKLGRVFSLEAGFKLDVATVRSPDVAFVAKGRLPQVPAGYIPLAPDLAVEVMSPGDTWPEVNTKVAEYQQAGVRLIWVVAPKERTVHVYHTDTAFNAPHIYGEDATVDGGDVIPGFRIAVSTIFDMDE